MSLDSTANNQTKISVVSHTASSGSLVLSTAGTSFPSVPFRLTCITGATYGTSSESLTIFAVSNVATNSPTSGQCTLTVSVAESTTDQTYGSSDYAEMRVTSGTISDLNTAVTASAYSLQGNATSSSATQGSIQAFTLGSPAITDTGIWQQLTVATSGYQQILAQNTSANTAASTDIVLNNNLGTATTYYIDLGINSSAFTGSGSLNRASAGYLSTTTVDLVLGTTTSNAIHFVIDGGATDAMTIGTDGGVTIGSPTGGDKGAGTINVAGTIYANGTALSGTGTVTSVGLTMPANFAVSGSPVTTTGTLAVTSTTPAVSIFTSSGTWTKPTGCTIVRVIVIGGGSGGGSGAIQASGTASSGGGGGAGGGYSDAVFSAADLPSTVTVTVGSGGVGGTAVSGTTASNGNSGGYGGGSSFGSYLTAGGSYPGGGGSTGTSGGGSAGWGYTNAGGAGQGCSAGAQANGLATIYNGITCGGGSGGGGVNSSGVGQSSRNAVNVSGFGGPGSSVTGGLAGTGGSSPTAGTAGGSYQGSGDANAAWCGYGGGGGGGASTGVSAGAGGAGGSYGGGGGGGGAAVTGTGISSGAGGAGGNGYVIVYSW